MNTNKLLLGAVAVSLALVAFAPTAQAAAAPGAGTYVVAGDVDAAYAYAASGLIAVCFVDTNNDGGQQATEPLYLSAACGAAGVAAGDVRLTAAFGKPGGTQVGGGDDDLSRNTLAAAGFVLKFYDADGNGVWNIGDVAYVGAVGVVAINNVALNGPNAFTRVTTTSPNYNSPTVTSTTTIAGGAATFYNADGVAGYGIADEIYVCVGPPAAGAACPTAAPAVGDVRLTGLGTVYAAATQVVGSDVDVTIAATVAVPYTTNCFVDSNGDALVTAGEPVYWQVAACGANSVASGDFRLLATAGKQGGTIVTGNDDDFSRNTIAVPAPFAAATSIRFFDADGSTTLTAGDMVVFDMDGSLTMTVNDIILTGTGKFTQVMSTTSGLNNPLTAHPVNVAFPAGVGFFNADAVGGAAAITGGDFLYIPRTAAPGAAGSGPSVNTVRLTPVGSLQAGTFVAGTDVDVVVALAATAHATFCFTDVDADGIQDATEPLYLIIGACGTGVKALDVRLTAVAPYSGGTLVGGSDDDFSRALVAGAAAYCIYDEDGSGAYTNGEPLFINLGATPCPAGATVTTNDVAVTTNQFVRVGAGTSGLNNPLIAPAIALGGELFFDADGNGLLSTKDTLYLDMDASGSVTIGDIRLTGTAGTTGQIGGDIGGGIGGSTSNTASSTSGSASSTSGSASSTSASATTTSGSGNTGGSDTTTTSKSSKTPGFELVALVAALGAALVLVRRKL